MEEVLAFVVAIIFAFWSFSLARKKEKRRPILWAIGGFLFWVIPVFALAAAPDPDELEYRMMEIAHKSAKKSK